MKLRFILGCAGWLVAALLCWRNFDISEKNSLEILDGRKALETEQKSNRETSERLKETENIVANLNSQLDSARQQYEKQRKQIQNETVSSASRESGKEVAEKKSPFIANLLRKAEHAKLLERGLVDHPERNIPELSFLKETDWLNESEKLGNNPSEKQMMDALHALTNTAQTNFFDKLTEWGGKSGLWTKLGTINSTEGLKSFFQSALRDSEKIDLSVFDRYEVVPRSEQTRELAWSIREKAPIAIGETAWNWGVKFGQDNQLETIEIWQDFRK
jgi:hypothetical protein